MDPTVARGAAAVQFGAATGGTALSAYLQRERPMSWTAITEHDAVDTGTTIHVDRGYSDSPPQNGHVIEVAHGGTGRTTSLTVVSAAADRLELTDGRRNYTLKPHAVTRPTILDAEGRYRDAWIVG